MRNDLYSSWSLHQGQAGAKSARPEEWATDLAHTESKNHSRTLTNINRIANCLIVGASARTVTRGPWLIAIYDTITWGSVTLNIYNLHVVRCEASDILMGHAVPLQTDYRRGSVWQAWMDGDLVTASHQCREDISILFNPNSYIRCKLAIWSRTLIFKPLINKQGALLQSSRSIIPNPLFPPMTRTVNPNRYPPNSHEDTSSEYLSITHMGQS